MLRELQTISAVDPAAAQRLIEQLQTVKPSLRGLAAEQFRASWQYHRERMGRGQAAAPHAPAPHGEAEVAQSATPQKHYDPAEFDQNETSPEPPRRLVLNMANAQAIDDRQVVAATHTAPITPLPSPTPDVVPVKTVTRDEELLAWRDHLDQAIAGLTTRTPDDPRSTYEAYEHARLRLLHLAAGNEEAALAPIPGLTPTEQSYWSNQMFALTTLLDHSGQPDDEQRAALASSQLTEAAAKLGELSALTVRNLAFCQHVYGYGDYEPHEKAVFKPGQAVTLYAEMENFRSESTEKGYHTSLATSYEVLDQNGNRVEGGEFGAVDDYCQRHRRDFYIEYTFELPKRIYASGYELRLMIRDRQSGKIGKASIEFKIAE